MKLWQTALLLSGVVLFVVPQAPIVSAGSSDTPQAETERWEKILEWEGGCGNHPADRGGETCYGVTASLARKYGVYNVRSLTKEQAVKIFKQQYPHCNEYKNTGVIDICADTSVNFGAAKTPRPGTNSWFSLSKGLDPNQPIAFIDGVCARRRQHRKDFIARNPEQNAFRQGWESRDEKACTFARGRA